jgi:hypothetical protein
MSRRLPPLSATAALVIASLLSSAEAQEIPTAFRVLGTTAPPEIESIPIPEGVTEAPSGPRPEPPRISIAELERGYIIFSRDCLELVTPDTVPTRRDICDQVRVSSVAGDYEPANVCIYAMRRLEGVEVSVGALQGPQGRAIGPENVDVRSVRCLPRWDGPATYRWLPTLLEKRSGITIESGRTHQFWLTFFVPPDAPPGLYRGTLHIRPANQDAAELPIRLRVLPLKLLTPPTLHGMYYIAVDMASAPEFRLLPAEQVRKDILNMAAHGMNTVFISIPPTCHASGEGGRIRFDLSPLRPLADACREAGFRAVVWNTTLSELIENPLGDFPTMLAAYLDALHAQGWPRIICSAGDESDANGTLEQTLGMLRDVKRADPQMTTFTTVVFPENSEQFGPETDIRAFSSYLDGPAVERTRKAGAQLWGYSGTAAYGLDPKGDRLYRGIWAAKIGLDGVLQWTYWHPVLDHGQPYNDLASPGNRNNMTCWVFPAEDGPLPSLGWEAMREGIEDGRYVFTLTTLIAHARQSGDADLRAAAEDAQQYLDSVFARIELSPRADNSLFVIRREAAKLDARFLDDCRRQMGRHIARLQ